MRKKNRHPYRAEDKGNHNIDKNIDYDIKEKAVGKAGDYKGYYADNAVNADDAAGDIDKDINNGINGGSNGENNDEILIHDLNDLEVQLQWAMQDAKWNGKPREREKQKRKSRAERNRMRKDSAQNNSRDGARAAQGGAGKESVPAGRFYRNDEDGGQSNEADREQRTGTDTEAISWVTRKNRRRKRRRTLFSVFLCLLALTALMGCFVLLLENRKLQDEVQVAMAYVDEVNSVAKYTEEEAHKLAADAAAETAERSSMEKEKEILDEIRVRMESGDGTAPMLRAIYKDELVVADDGRYYFFPIVDTLKHHSYQADQFRMNEEDILEYFVDGNVVSKKGIDVSRYQGDIDWKKVAGDGVEYAFIRLGIRGSSEGNLVLDNTYEANIKGALKNDIAVGVYFFTQALNKEEAVEEAEFVLEHMEGYDVAYPVVLDVEEVATNDPRTEGMTQQDWTDVCIAFCDRIRDAGYTPMIYGNLKTFLLMLDLEQLEDYEKWFAFYQTPLYFPYEFSVWQYTSTGSVDGIKGDVDMNVSMKDWGSEESSGSEENSGEE